MDAVLSHPLPLLNVAGNVENLQKNTEKTFFRQLHVGNNKPKTNYLNYFIHMIIYFFCRYLWQQANVVCTPHSQHTESVQTHFANCRMCSQIGQK